MEDTQKRLEALERRVRRQSAALLAGALVFAVFAAYSFLDLGSRAAAQVGQGYFVDPVKIPATVEARAFVLKDNEGVVRGMWSTDSTGTTFATAFKDKTPAVVIRVDTSDAFVAVTGSRGERAELGLHGSYGGTYLDLTGIGRSRIGMSASEARVEIQGDMADLSLVETDGSYVGLSSRRDGGRLSFVDGRGFENLVVRSGGGESVINMVSQAIDGILTLMPEDGTLQDIRDKPKRR